MNTPTAKPYKAWDLPTRLFHWINFLCVITLSFLGLVMLNKGATVVKNICHANLPIANPWLRSRHYI